MAEPSLSCVEVRWVANPFRGDKFEAAWSGAAEAALDYGASSYALFRSKEDPLTFTQLAFFESKLDWERYWFSEEISAARAEATGLFQVPVVPIWHRVVAMRSRTTEPVEG